MLFYRFHPLTLTLPRVFIFWGHDRVIFPDPPSRRKKGFPDVFPVVGGGGRKPFFFLAGYSHSIVSHRVPEPYTPCRSKAEVGDTIDFLPVPSCPKLSLFLLEFYFLTIYSHFSPLFSNCVLLFLSISTAKLSSSTSRFTEYFKADNFIFSGFKR